MTGHDPEKEAQMPEAMIEKTTVEQGETLAENENFKLVNDEQPGNDLPQDILDAFDTVRRRESTWKELNEEAKDAKKSWEAAVETLMDRLEDHRTGQHNLFTENGDATTEPASDAWRAFTIAAALEGKGLPAKVFEKLAEADVITLGDMTDWTKDKLLTDIKGIGEKTAEQIEEALTSYWEENPQDGPKKPEDGSIPLDECGFSTGLAERLMGCGIKTSSDLIAQYAEDEFAENDELKNGDGSIVVRLTKEEAKTLNAAAKRLKKAKKD